MGTIIPQEDRTNRGRHCSLAFQDNKVLDSQQQGVG